MDFRDDILVKNGRNNRNFLGKRKEKNLSELSNMNKIYLSNNIFQNDYLGIKNSSSYKNQNNYLTAYNAFDYPLSDADNFENNLFQNVYNDLSESNEETDDEELKNESEMSKKSKDALIKLERKKRKFLENKLKCLQASMKQKQLYDSQDRNEKLYKKMTARNLMRSHSNTNSVQSKNINRRFEGDGNDNEELNCRVKNKILLKKDNLDFQNNDFLDFNSNQTHNNSNLKFKDIKLLNFLNQQKFENFSDEINRNFIGPNCNSMNEELFKIDNKNLNLESTRNVKKNVKDNILNHDKQFKNNYLDDYNLNNYESKFFGIDQNIKNKIISSMKYNFDSMLDFIQNQSFSQDGFMAIQQFINIIMMQNCQFMNHQQILLCWLQKLQHHFTTNSNNISSLRNKSFTSYSNDQKLTIPDTVKKYKEDINNCTNQLNDLNLKNSSTLNNQVDLITKNNNYFDNLKSDSYKNQLNVKTNMLSNSKNLSSLTNNNLINADSSLNNLVYYEDQQSSFSSDQTSNNTNSLSNLSPKLKKLSNNNSKITKSSDKANKSNSQPSSDLKEIYDIIEKLIEDKKDYGKNFLAKLKSFKDFYDFEDHGQAVGVENTTKVDLNSHSDNSVPGMHSKKTTYHNIVNTLKIATNGNLSSSSSNSNKSPQLGLYISPSTGAIRKRTNNNTDSVEPSTSKSIEQIQQMHLSLSDEKNKSETVRPLMAAEGRSSESQSKVLAVNNSIINSVISSTISNNSNNSIVPAATSTSNGRVLLKRHPLTRPAKYNQNIDSDNSSDKDSPLSSIDQVEPISENENNSSSIINQIQVTFVESFDRDNLEQKDEKRGSVNLARNDTEVRLSGDGEQGF